MGCRRPTGLHMYILHMYLQTRVTLRAFPVATPRGRSSSSHEGETQLCNLLLTFFLDLHFWNAMLLTIALHSSLLNLKFLQTFEI